MNDFEINAAHEKVKPMLKVVREMLDEKVSLDDPAGCAEKLMKLVDVSGTVSHAESLAKATFKSSVSNKLVQVMTEMPEMGASNMKQVAEGQCGIYYEQQVYAERLGRMVSHAIEGMRSIVSLQKAQLEQSQYGSA